MKKLFLVISLFCFVLCVLTAQTSSSALTADVTVDGTTYPKTGFVEVSGVTITGSGNRGAFISGRTVTLSPYIIGKYLVTQDFYKAVAKKIPDAYTAPSKYKSDTLADGEEQGLRPVEQVDFFEVARFCNKLSELQGLEPVFTINGDSVTFDISKNGWRLPTEAEWECAARGGNPNVGSNWNRVFAGATSENTALNYAWIKSNSDGVTHEVGLKTPNSLGLYDMIGNVFEWCIDLSSDIETGTFTNPTGGTTGTMRVQRSCSKGSSKAKDSLERDEGEQSDYWPDVGFRLCRTIPASAATTRTTQTSSTTTSRPTQTTTTQPATTTTNTTTTSTAQTTPVQTTPAASQTTTTTTTQTTTATSGTTQLDPTSWKKDTFTTSWKDYEWSFPVTKLAVGENSITFTYKSGGKKLCLKDAVIIADGRTILTDNTEKSAGSNPKSAVYTFTLTSVPRTLVMKAKARTDGGTNSVGTITVANHPHNNDKWVPNEFTTTWTERTYDMTEQLVPGASGLTVTFTYTSGAKKLCARNLVFMADGREIARSNDEVSAGTNPRSFTVSCTNIPANTSKLVLKGEFRTDGGTESYGTITAVPKLYTKQGTTININNGVKTLTRWALSDETNATRIVIPSSVTTIENGALLKYCTISCATQQQKNYCLENGFAVEGTYSIRNGVLTINSGVTLVSPLIARENTTITKIVLPETVKTIDAYAFYGMTNLTAVNIPSSTEVIGASAFQGCSKLSSVTLPKTLKYIGTNAFRYTKVTSINIGYDTVYEEETHSNAGYAVDMYRTNITVNRDAAPASSTASTSSKPAKKTDTPSTSSSSNSAVKKEGTPVGQPSRQVDLSNAKKQSATGSATSTPVRSESTKLTNGVLEIGTKTTQLGASSYKGNAEIKKVIIPGTVKYIGDSSFYNCPNLEEVIIDEGVEQIGFAAFMCNKHLVSLTIPKSVKKISPYKRTWFYHNNFKLVVRCYAGSAGYDFARAMGFDIELLGIDEQNADKITTLVYGKNTTIPPVEVKCKNVEQITIGMARQIPDGAFANCTAKRIDIPATVTSIGFMAFNNASNLRVVRGSYAETWARQNGYYLCETLADLSTYTKTRSLAITENFTRILCNDESTEQLAKYRFNVTHPLSLDVVDGRLELTSYMLYPCENVTVTKKASDGTKTTVATYNKVQPLARYVVLAEADNSASYTVTSSDSFYKKLNDIPVNWEMAFSTKGSGTSVISVDMNGAMCREWISLVTQLAYIIGSNSFENYFLSSSHRFFTGDYTLGLNSTATNYLTDAEVRSLYQKMVQYSTKLGATDGKHIDEYAGVGSKGGSLLCVSEQGLCALYYDPYEYAVIAHEMMHNMGYDHDSNFCRNKSNQIIYQDEFATIVEQLAAVGDIPYFDDTILSTKVLWADDYFLKN